jgi:hypothetical protein
MLLRSACCVAAIALSSLVTACGPVAVGLVNNDRPEQDGGLAPPVAFEPCTRESAHAERHDHDNDGHTDTIHIMDNGAEVCRGSDSDSDGKIDTWDVVDNGKIAMRGKDTDQNGKVDQVWTWKGATPDCALIAKDADGDGRAEGEATQTVCGVSSVAVAEMAEKPAKPAQPIVPLATPAPAPATAQ